MNNPVCWFEIYVEDMNRAKAFYESVLGVHLTKIEGAGMESMEMWQFPMQENNYGAGGSLVKMEGFSAGANSVIVYFSCADCAVEAAKATEFGGRLLQEKMSIGEYGHIALVADTEGNTIGLHSMQ